MTEHHILQGDVLDGLRTLPDNSVQCCITSPPYYGLRNYGADGQIGLEETPEQFIQKMVEVFREVRRVTRPDGVLWLNLGDSYSGSSSSKGAVVNQNSMSAGTGQDIGYRDKPLGIVKGYKAKDLMGIPWRVAFALQADGWYLRSDIIWAKPNPMPESVTDRPTKSHEYIFLLTKSARYYYDADAIREDATTIENRPFGIDRARGYDGKLNLDENAPAQFKRKENKQDQTGNPTYTGFNDRYAAKMARNGTNIPGHSGNFKADGTPICDGITRNARTVWTITTQARPEAHFATFPDEIPRRCIKAGTKIGDTVLDPFMGSGTVAVIARELNRSSVGCEINPEYVKIIRKRLQADSQLDTGVVSYRFEKVEA